MQESNPQIQDVFFRGQALDLYYASGLIEDPENIPPHMELFLEQSGVVLQELQRRVHDEEMQPQKAQAFQSFLQEVGDVVMRHPVVSNNRYLKRFSEGPTEDQARHLFRQFAVFGAQFDVAQAQLLANARTPEEYEQRWQLLMNELGCPFKNAQEFEGELNGRVAEKWNHKTWLHNDGDVLGLAFDEIGQIWNGTDGTQKFVSAVFNRYASVEPNVAASAAFSIETWAGNALWKPWIKGMEKLKDVTGVAYSMTYLTYHDKEEEHHSQGVLSAALENFCQDWFDQEQYLDGVRAMLDSIKGFYESQLETLPGCDETWPAEACPFERAAG